MNQLKGHQHERHCILGRPRHMRTFLGCMSNDSQVWNPASLAFLMSPVLELARMAFHGIHMSRARRSSPCLYETTIPLLPLLTPRASNFSSDWN